MPLCFAQNLDSRVHVQKRRRSGGYVEAFGHVLSDSEASETYGYLIWIILDKHHHSASPLQLHKKSNHPYQSIFHQLVLEKPQRHI